jgi:hypothetical protein
MGRRALRALHRHLRLQRNKCFYSLVKRRGLNYCGFSMPIPSAASAVKRFHDFWGKPETYGRPDNKTLRQMPPALRALVTKDGWASYRSGQLWTCDPKIWDAQAWLENRNEPSKVWVRTGFGDMYPWDGTFFWQVLPHLSACMHMTFADHWLLGHGLIQPDVHATKGLTKPMARALKVAGKLEPDEMYNYAPALALGGSEKSSKIVRVKARECLELLRQLSPVKTFTL